MTLEEKQLDVKEWDRRSIRAAERVTSGKYQYTQEQDEEDGLSSALIDDEFGAQCKELKTMIQERPLSTLPVLDHACLELLGYSYKEIQEMTKIDLGYDYE